MKNLIIALSLIISSSALAQDTVDAHGFHMVPTDGDLLDGLVTWPAERQEAGALSGNVLFEYGREPLVLHHQDETGELSSQIIDSYSALNLGAFYSPHERLALTVSAPLFLDVSGNVQQQGVGLGDVRAAASLGVILPQEDRTSFGLSVVPFLDVPGFYDESQLGLDGVSGGGLVAASFSDEKWSVGAHAGVQFSPDIEFYNLEGREHLTSALFVGTELSEDVALRGELLYEPVLRKNDFAGTDRPLEVIGSLRGQSGDHLSWTFGGSSALTKSVGAATWRVFAGLDFAFGARHTEEAECAGVWTTVRVWEEAEGGLIPVTDGEVHIDGVLFEGQPVHLEDGSTSVIDVIVPSGVTVENDTIFLSMPVFFDFDKSELRYPEGHTALRLLAIALEAHPDADVIIHGHADSRAGDDYNVALSERRIESVKSFLIEELGVEFHETEWWW